MTSPACTLPMLGSLVVRGDDARSFLQNQLSSDLALVTDTSGQLSGWHDPKGRVLAFLRVLPHAEGFLLVMHAGLLATVAQRMRMFVLRARVTIEAGPAVYGVSAEALATLLGPGMSLPETSHPESGGPVSAGALPAIVTGRRSALRLPGAAGWLVAGEVPPEQVADDATALAAWERAELEAGLPEVYPETSGEFVAQMLNLDRIGAISFTKGCYPGQEIVARAHHLGRVKRRAQVFRLPGPPPAPGAVLDEPAGKVVRAVPLNGESLVMVVVAEPEG
ncbi:folate-binding protein YgfZ [Thioalkalivibrio sp. XN279]|uniref:CAF17-like 4Fe-4S cluster assembly/insertion protein YgfZ n=1 Tax=Thioalkalivibrio sp. XN279 TaxID=2714953 RepID=UPI001409B3F3|nr:folate-binding protein YgfZ [Thioalkalivibrio sp. XN279]NHA15267.1 folate-binding protein YgfZ [Thioalkalivibrio sp. XN279]